MGDSYVFDAGRLSSLVEVHASSFRGAKPFPHVVMDSFCPDPALLDQILLEIDAIPTGLWTEHEYENSRGKRELSDVGSMGPRSMELLLQLNAGPFVRFLEQLTGISGLIPDPDFNGGGLHDVAPGGYLGVHADFNRHERMRLDRRLNLILYLNRSWAEDDGGELELYGGGGEILVERVAPRFNRCVVFATTSDSYHGHPRPNSASAGRSRRSVAACYYTNGRPSEEVSEAHLTSWAANPEGSATGTWTT